jgi:heme-degrading monooxygenase HmoA
MILEIAFVEIRPECHEDFERAVINAVDVVLSTASGPIDFERHRGIEQENTYIFKVRWNTLEDHTVKFRQSELFTQWRGLISEYFAKPPHVEHWSLRYSGK